MSELNDISADEVSHMSADLTVACSSFACMLMPMEPKSGMVIGEGCISYSSGLIEIPSLGKLVVVDSINESPQSSDQRCRIVYQSPDSAFGEREKDLDFGFIYPAEKLGECRVRLGACIEQLADQGIIGGCRYGDQYSSAYRQFIDHYFARFRLKVHFDGTGLWWTAKPPLNVSFIIPAYNCEKTLEESVRSIVDTNMQPADELVIVDDGSTDGTWDLMRTSTLDRSKPL